MLRSLLCEGRPKTGEIGSKAYRLIHIGNQVRDSEVATTNVERPVMLEMKGVNGNRGVTSSKCQTKTYLERMINYVSLKVRLLIRKLLNHDFRDYVSIRHPCSDVRASGTCNLFP